MGFPLPKQFIHVCDKPIFIWTARAFEQNRNIDSIYIVCLEGYEEYTELACKTWGITKFKKAVAGGSTNYESICNGIREIAKDGAIPSEDVVLIHDGNRPLVTQEIINDCIATYKKHKSAVAYIPSTEVLFRHNSRNRVDVLDRDTIIRTQTPHAFSLHDVQKLIKKAKELGVWSPPALCGLYATVFWKPGLYKGDDINFKITTASDLEIFKAIMKERVWR